MIQDNADIIGVGWDVRGWQSSEQATAVAKFCHKTKSIEWLGVSSHFKFKAGSKPGFLELAEPAVGKNTAEKLINYETITIAIDAPLSFPVSLYYLIQGINNSIVVPKKEIDNGLAFRDCERWIKKNHNKKPLSATFDKLGNNTSLAMSIALNLEAQNFQKIPQTSLNSKRAIIEVYPALAKIGAVRTNPIFEKLSPYIPESCEVGSDQYDAAICAFMALLFQGVGNYINLPELVTLQDGFNNEEGWIYACPPNSLTN